MPQPCVESNTHVSQPYCKEGKKLFGDVVAPFLATKNNVSNAATASLKSMIRNGQTSFSTLAWQAASYFLCERHINVSLTQKVQVKKKV
jgi:hypothetical protein